MTKAEYQKFAGVYALMLTPYNDDLTVNYDAYAEYTEFQAATGAGHLFAVCGTSEMAELTLDEREKLAKLTVKHANGTPVVATANMEPSWFAQVDEVKRMSQTGVDGLVFVTKGMHDDPERQFTYLSELAQHTELPLLLYEFPGCQPHKMEADVYKRLVDTGRFVGIKDTTSNMKDICEKIDVQGDSNILQANVPLLLEAWKAGARGVMATPTSCGAQLFQRMWEEFTAGDLDAAHITIQYINHLDNAIDSGFNVSAKYLVQLQGVEGMKPINRGHRTLSEPRMQSLRTYYYWAKANGLAY
ncbi:MAG: dihydrodipicolinate synthase family protein [Clostridia bacterium]|nr:dihydrodipicolinate synthase family protein [Clostridia bacterium]